MVLGLRGSDRTTSEIQRRASYAPTETPRVSPLDSSTARAGRGYSGRCHLGDSTDAPFSQTSRLFGVRAEGQ